MKKTYFIAKVALMTLSLIFFTFLFQNYTELNARSKEFNKYVSTDFLQVVDVYQGDGLYDLFNNDNGLKKMMSFNEDIKNSFDTFSVDYQDVYLVESLSFTYQESFRADYETDMYGLNDEYGIPLSSVQIDQNTCSYFELEKKVIEGEFFSPEDFFYVEDKVVPVLLGNEYRGVTNLGANLKINYLSKEMDAKVVGFLEPNVIIAFDDNIVSMDRKIILPFFDIKESDLTSINGDFPNYLYSQKNWMYIRASSDFTIKYYMDKVQSLSSSYGLKYIINGTLTKKEIESIGTTINAFQMVFSAFIVVAILLMTISFSILSFLEYLRAKPIVSIYFLCGYNSTRIKAKFSIQFFLISVLSIIISFLIISIINNTLKFSVLFPNIIFVSIFDLISIIAVCCFIDHFSLFDYREKIIKVS